jgi:hypothetical protein
LSCRVFKGGGLTEELPEFYVACGDTEAALEADHGVPLTRGGTDDIGNIRPLYGPCNRKKFVSIVDYRLGADVFV